MQSLIEYLSSHPDYMAVDNIPGILVDLRYASENNFMNTNVYHDFRKPFLHKIAGEKLIKAREALNKIRPDWNMLLLDCLRPASAHLKLWNFVKNTPQETYVANPENGSLHSFGFAVDLTLLNENNEPVDMATEYDSFHDLAQPRYELKMIESGLLLKEQLDNRAILRNAMESAGFRQLSFEWWHYDAEDPVYVRKNFKKIE